MKTEKEIRDQVRAIRQRVGGMSGYWVGEGAAAIYALEWVNGKRAAPPSEDIGSAGGEHEKIAAALLKLADQAKPAAPPEARKRQERGKKTKSPAKKKS